MPASMPSSNSPYPTAPLAILIASNDQKSINNNNNNCNGAVRGSATTTTTQIDNTKLSHRNPSEKSNRKEYKMNLQVVCITVTLVICCIVITGLEVWNSMQTWKLQTDIDVLNGKLATLQTNFDQLKNNTSNFVSRNNNNRPPLQSDRQKNVWPDRNSSEEYEDEYYYDDDDVEHDIDDNNDDGEDVGRNESIGGTLISPQKESFDTEFTGTDDRDLLPLLEDQFDASVTEQTERNETVKRTSRSVSPGANGIPVIDGTYAANRKSIEENHDGAAVDESHRLSESRADVPPRFHHDWSDRTAAAAIRKYPKKYESPSDDSDASERIPHRHRHRRKQLRPTMATSPQSDQTKNFPLINGLTSLPATIDFSNLYENSHFDQDMQSSSSQLNEEIIRHTDAFQPKTRRRILRPPEPTAPVVRAARSPMHPSGMRFKTIAVHYQGDTSAYTTGAAHHLERFEGNGRIRHPGGIYSDWKPAYWVDDHAMERFFVLQQGVVTVKENGLYYIYAQIFYHDDHDTNGYIIEHNLEPLYQCTTATHSNQRVTKSNTCHTAGINYLNAGDTIHIKDLGSHRYTLFDASKSFFGLIKVGDLRGGGVAASSSTST